MWKDSKREGSEEIQSSSYYIKNIIYAGLDKLIDGWEVIVRNNIYDDWTIEQCLGHIDLESAKKKALNMLKKHLRRVGSVLSQDTKNLNEATEILKEITA